MKTPTLLWSYELLQLFPSFTPCWRDVLTFKCLDYWLMDIWKCCTLYLSFIFEDFFKSSFRFSTQAPLASLVRTHTEPPPCPASPTGVVHLSQPMSLHWHVIIISLPEFTLGFALGVVHNVDLDQSIMTLTLTLKIFCVLLIHLSPPTCSGQPLIFLWSP